MSTEDLKDILDILENSSILEKLSQGFILMEHYRPHTGSGPHYQVFYNLEQFKNYISSAGYNFGKDEYTVWSVADLVDRKKALASGKYAGNSKSILSERDLETIKSFLEAGSKVDLDIIGGFVDPKTGETYTNINCADNYLDVIEDLSEYNRPGGEVYIFPSLRNGLDWFLFKAKH
ncbi:MAG TPA: hypothetical protein VH186_02705 [Chloroflexia bacterium]|nr:hypothetical protein [Chloroflexia bacterium]